MAETNGVRIHEMTPQRLLELVGSRREIALLFRRRRMSKSMISPQAISKWFKAGRIPPKRLIQLATMKPEWFR